MIPSFSFSQRAFNCRHTKVLIKQSQTIPDKSSLNSDKPGGHTCIVLILFLLCLLTFLPVLIHGHWGLYSDPRQIVENCRTFYSSPTIRWDIIQGFYRPGFHSLDLGMWSVSRNQPSGYFLFRYIVFATAVCCTYLSCYKLSGWRLISVSLSLAWLCLSPTFEVIYTLDKAETYLVCLFSIFILTHVTTVSKILRGECRSTWIFAAAVMIFVCTGYAISTKETGQLLLLFGLMLPISNLIADRIGISASGDRIQANIRRQLSLWFWVAGGLCVTAFAIYKSYFVLNGGLKASYGGLSLQPEFIVRQLFIYIWIVPDFFMLLGFCVISCIVIVVRDRQLPPEQAHDLTMAGTMTVIAGAGSVALLSWKSVIVYSWFPLFALLLPAASVCLTLLALTRTWRTVCVVSIVSLLIAVLPQRLVQAQLQFQFDDLVQDLVRIIASSSLSAKTKLCYGMPFLQPEYAEVVEDLESLTLSHLNGSYVESPRDSNHLPAVKFFNFVNYQFPSDVRLPSGTTSLTAARNQNLQSVKAEGYLNEPGVDKYSYWSNNGHGQNWTVDNLREGDIILVPVGDLPPSFASYRGLGMFCTDWKTKLAFLPQVDFEPVFAINRKITRLGGHRFTIGWRALEVKSVPRISWFIDRGGNLRDGVQIFADRDLSGRSLVLTVGLSHAMLIWQRFNGNDTPLTAKPVGGNLLELRVPFSKTSAAGRLETCLHLQPFGGQVQEKAVFLHVERARIE